MLEAHGEDMENRTVIISGAGDVATYAAEQAIASGAKVVSLSDSAGRVHDPDGLTQERIDWVRAHKAKSGAKLEAYAKEFGANWIASEMP